MPSNHLIFCHPLLLPSIFPSIRVFSMSQLFASGDQSIGASASASASVLPMNIQDSFPLGLTGLISLQSKGLSRVFSNSTVEKASVLQCSAFFMVQPSHPYMTTGKTIALTWWTFVSKVMSLLFNTPSRSVIAFLPRSKCLSISQLAVTICSGFGAQENKVWHYFHCFPIYFPWRMGLDAMIFVFWMLSFKPTFSLSSFTFIKRLFSSSLLSATRVVSSVYLSYWYFF